MIKKKLLISLLLFTFCLACFTFAQSSISDISTSWNDTMTSIRQEVAELRAIHEQDGIHIQDLESYNKIMDEKVDELSEKIEQDAEKMSQIISELTITNEKLSKANNTNRKLIWIFIIFLIIHAVIVFLNLKFHIKLPYLINSIL